MTTPDTATLAPDGTFPALDGRRERSKSSRAKIVAAMLELVGAGNVAPSAAEIAETAGVGLRSVFRHFTDMDALYREMTVAIVAKVAPIIARAPEGDTWQARVRDLAGRRALVFEAIMPYRISANARRYESAYLEGDFRRMLRLESEALRAHLPPHVLADATGAQGLGVILSFATWRLLRHDQRLPEDEALAVVRRMLDDALARWPEE